MTEEIQTRFSPNYLAIAIIAIITATILVIILIDHIHTQNKVAELKGELIDMCMRDNIYPCTTQEIVRRDLER